MNVLVACEFSGVVRQAFRDRGHAAYSVDLLPSDDGSAYHYQTTIQAVIADTGEARWDLLVAHPPCTCLTVAGARWFKGREAEQADAIAFVEWIWGLAIPRVAIENPIGVLSTRSSLGKPAQIIQPWQFGHPESKATCLWLKGLPALQPTHVLTKPSSGRWDNQTASGQNKLGPSPDRWKVRSRTYEGIAAAMAEQWGSGCNG